MLMGDFRVLASIPSIVSQAFRDFFAPESKAVKSQLLAGDPGCYVWI